MIEWDDPETWLQRTPVPMMQARPFVAAAIGKPVEITTDADIWEYRMGKVGNDEYKNDPWSDQALADYYKEKSATWKVE